MNLAQPSPGFDGLIFDCDGTLALTADLHFDALAAAFARQGLVMHRAWYQARTGLARRDLIAAFAQDTPVPDPERVVADSIALTLTAASGACVPNRPVVDFAQAWFGRVPMAVASNAERPVVLAILKACQIATLFDPILTLTEAVVAKPDPRMFVMAAQALGLPPARCLVLEDSAQGLQAAARGGMQAVDVRTPEGLARLAAV